MNIDLLYANEKMQLAVHSLAVGYDELPERLRVACVNHVTHANSPGHDIPEDIEQRIDSVMNRMTSEPDPSNIGTIAATAATLSQEDAVQIANDICDIATDIRNELRDRRRA